MSRSRAAIFINLSKSLSTPLIASFLVLICFVFLFHKHSLANFAPPWQAFADGTTFPFLGV